MAAGQIGNKTFICAIRDQLDPCPRRRERLGSQDKWKCGVQGPSRIQTGTISDPTFFCTFSDPTRYHLGSDGTISDPTFFGTFSDPTGTFSDPIGPSRIRSDHLGSNFFRTFSDPTWYRVHLRPQYTPCDTWFCSGFCIADPFFSSK